MDWFILLSGIFNLFLGATIFFQNPRARLNFGFGLFSVVTFILILLDFLFRFQSTLLVLQAAYAMAVLVPATATIWILELSKTKFRSLPILGQALLIASPIIFFILPFVDGLIIQKITRLTLAGYQGILGPLFPLYGLYFLFYILFFVRLLLRARKGADKEFAGQTFFVLFGIATYGIIASISSIILPQVFGIFDFTLFDAPSLLFFVGFTFYAIQRHHLFNVKIIAAQLFVISLSLFIFVRIILGQAIRDQILDGVLLLATVIIGILFIRSITQEIRSRERIEKLAKDLEEANEKLTELDKLKSEFVSIASHQLRSPLTAIKGYISLILEGSFGAIPPTVKEPLERVFDSTNLLVKSVEDFLNVSRIEQGRMKYEMADFDLSKLVSDTVLELSVVAQKKGLTLSMVPDSLKGVMINGDIGKLKQVFINLIDNAIKYTPTGWIKVLVGQAKDPSFVRITISDSGIGMTQETINKLFQRFSRAVDANKTNTTGTGLGLYVVKQMVEGHAGRVWTESDGPGKGSRFIVELKKK